ncbi:hypothetical protein LXA43DRAFT_886024 [Ganoderma leucocontextum]|nr:hypothetical protein LXA43DRAFT_886024 [Ganoderma leucocontextum]
MPRTYALRQTSYWFREEWTYLDEAVLNPDVQEFLGKGNLDKARGLLVALFRLKFTGPVRGETDEEFKKRLRGTSKVRKALVAQRSTESLEQWQARMVTLPDEVATWLKTWRSRNVRQGGKRWVPPLIALPPKRKARANTPFDVFCKSNQAPKGEDFLTADGRRCDVPALRAARKVAWDKLSDEQKASFRQPVEAMVAERAGFQAGQEEDAPGEADSEAVAHAEDIAAHVDQFVTGLHESVSWGGFAVFGGPDEKGEARIHVTGAGTNRHGLTFLDAFLQTVGWTQLEFETVFALWVEQCREGERRSFFSRST